MSFEALSCKGGASISICTSRALMFGVLVWHILGSTTVIMLPCMLTRGGTRLFLDSNIQHFILATYETTMIQQVSYRPIKCQSWLWPQELRRQSARHIKVKALKPTGIQYVAIARYNKRRTSELRSTVSTVWNNASLSGSELQLTEKII